MKGRRVHEVSKEFRDYLIGRMEKKKFHGAVLVGKPADEGGTMLVGAPLCNVAQVEDVAYGLVSMATDLLSHRYPADVISEVVDAYVARRLMEAQNRANQEIAAQNLGSMMSGGIPLPGGGVGVPFPVDDND